MYVVQSIISYEHVTSFRLAIKGFHNLFEMLHFSPKKKKFLNYQIFLKFEVQIHIVHNHYIIVIYYWKKSFRRRVKLPAVKDHL